MTTVTPVRLGRVGVSQDLFYSQWQYPPYVFSTWIMAANAKVALMLLATGATSLSAASQPPLPHDDSRAIYQDQGNGGDWPGYGRTFGEQHYSPLAQIDEITVPRLG